MSHEPRVILVTGASSGIGRAVAHEAARSGEHLVLVARGVQSLRDTAEECDSAGAASSVVIPTDVGDDSAVEACVAEAIDRYGQLDGVVHCAGVVAYGRTEDIPPDVFDGVLRTNLAGSVNVARHVIPVLRRQERGMFVLVGSVIGHIAVPSMSPYVLSKWGIHALARQLQLENRDRPGVWISYLAPGGVDTPIYRQAANYAGFASRPPPPVMSPERVARVILSRFDRPVVRNQVGLTNDIIRFGFSFVPWAYDRLVGPMFALVARDQTRPVEPGSGNVLRSQDAGNELHGHPGSSVVGVARNIAARLSAVRRRAAA